MKKISYILASLFVAVSLVSCNLDSMSLTEKDTTNFPKTEADAAQILAAVYQNMNKINESPQCSYHYVALLASDDMYGGGGDNDKLMQAHDLLCNYGTDATAHFFQARYEGINRANGVISALEGLTFDDPNVKNQAMGEALFLRAYYYYELASMYGKVPLVLGGAEIITPDTHAQVWGQILLDLKKACDIMPAVRKTDGHVDKYTAEALLGRCWLYYTGMFCNGETLADLTSENYSPLTSVTLADGKTLTKEDVAKYIDDAVEHSGCYLVSDYRNLWAYTNRCTVEDYPLTKGLGLAYVENDNAVSPETMFAVKFNKAASWGTTIGYANGYALHFGVRGQVDEASRFPWGEGWGAGPVAPNLIRDWKAAEPTDMRRDASVEDMSKRAEYRWGGGANMQETALHQMKFGVVTCKNPERETGYSVSFEQVMYPGGWDIITADNIENFQLCSIHDMVMIRYAEVLLMQSELRENASGMNEVRKRAGLKETTYSLDNILNERRWELAFEGVRWMDIRRTHRAQKCLDAQIGQPIRNAGNETTNTAQNGGYSARYNATAGFFKIPETQVTLLNGAIQQNVGYDKADSEYNGWN